MAPDDLEQACAQMHARYRAFARIQYWSVVEWYRLLREDGTHGPQIPLAEPLVVWPVAEGYELRDARGAVAYAWPCREVSEFEDTLFSANALPAPWGAVVASA